MMNAELAFQSGVLSKDHHSRLVADLENFAKDAFIQPHHIWTKLSVEEVGEASVNYVRRFKFQTQEKISGLALVGKAPKIGPEDRMAAMTGALVRNFVRARVLTANQVIEVAESGRLNDFACIMIPNFHTGALSSGKDQQAAWRVGILLDVFFSRHALGLQTVVYASNMTEVAHEYGPAMKRHIENHFTVVNI